MAAIPSLIKFLFLFAFLFAFIAVFLVMSLAKVQQPWIKIICSGVLAFLTVCIFWINKVLLSHSQGIMLMLFFTISLLGGLLYTRKKRVMVVHRSYFADTINFSVAFLSILISLALLSFLLMFVASRLTS